MSAVVGVSRADGRIRWSVRQSARKESAGMSAASAVS